MGENLKFQAEVAKLLDIVVHSLYSNNEIFLRELISNASDACDKLRYAALTQPELTAGDGAFRVTLAIDKAARTLTVADNGIGMNHDDLVENLGTIARSGTAAFMNQLSGESKKDVALIGQFGVGFYSAFMVANKVEVTSRKAGEDQAWKWLSEGQGEYSVEAIESDRRGTTIVMHLRDNLDEFLDPHRLRAIVKKYSDHIAIPVVLLEDEGKEDTLNSASALWTRSKSEITPEQYKEFYHHAAHAFDEPWLTLHYKAEGVIEYTALLFLPSTKPFDLFHPDRKQRVKLYVKRVFITDDCEDLLPPYLRFLKGVVDSEDMPLNVSREMLQHNPIIAKIRHGLVKRIISELQKKAEAAPEEYLTFWENFGAVLKEGVYEDFEQRDTLIDLCRFQSTAVEGYTSLADYVGRMKPGQEAIYYMTGEDLGQLRRSPHLEGFRAKGVEVLLMTDGVDEFWLPGLGQYKEKPFKSVTRGGADLGKIEGADKDAPKEEEKPEEKSGIDALAAVFKLALGDAVKDVRASERLTDSAVCLVADDGDMDMRLERMLRQHKQLETASKRVLEINPKHPLIKRLAKQATGDNALAALGDAAQLLLDQARIIEGDPVPDPAAFARRVNAMMEKGLVA